MAVPATENQPEAEMSPRLAGLTDFADAPPMTTVANCSLLIQAQLMQAALAGSGIKAFIPDELTVESSGNLYSLAIGGIRVQVEDEDADAARAVLAALPPAAETAP